MIDDYEIKLEKILTGITNEYQLKLKLVEYCDLQVSEYDFDFFGVLFFERNPLVKPFFISKPAPKKSTLLDIDRIPWKNEPKYRMDTVKLLGLKRKDPVRKAIKKLAGMKLKSLVIAPIIIKGKMVGSIIAGYKRKKRIIKEGIIYLAGISSIQITEAIKKTASNEAWAKLHHITALCYDYSVSRLANVPAYADLIVEILQKVFDLSCVLIIRLGKSLGYVYYFAEINEKGTISSETGPFEGKNFISIPKEKKVEGPFLEVPIVENKEYIGKLFLSYENMDNIFKEEILEIVQPSALHLSSFIL